MKKYLFIILLLTTPAFADEYIGEAFNICNGTIVKFTKEDSEILNHPYGDCRPAYGCRSFDKVLLIDGKKYLPLFYFLYKDTWDIQRESQRQLWIREKEDAAQHDLIELYNPLADCK